MAENVSARMTTCNGGGRRLGAQTDLRMPCARTDADESDGRRLIEEDEKEGDQGGDESKETKGKGETLFARESKGLKIFNKNHIFY